MAFDEIFDKVGGYGKFQKKMLLLTFLFGIPSAFNTLITVFIHDVPEHHCNVSLSSFTKTTLNDSIPMEMDTWGNSVFSSCFQYNNSTERADKKLVIPCQNGWQYNVKKHGFVSVSTEFNLVCDNSIITSSIESMFLGARGVAMILAGVFSDRFGRKVVLLVALIVQNISVFAASFSTNLWLYTALIMIYGGTGTVTYLSCYNLACEMTGNKWRNRVNMFLNSGYIVGYMFMSLFAYLVPHWRHLLRYIALCGTMTIFMLCIIPESPRWLLSKKHTKTGLTVLKKIAKENKVKADDNLLEEVYRLTEEEDEKAEKSERQNKNLIVLLKHRKFVVEIAVLILCWMFTNITYYGLALNSSSLGGDRYINCFLSGAMEFPAILITYILMEKIGRPYTLAATLIFGGIFCVISPFTKPASQFLSSFFAIVGKSGLTGTYYAVIGYTPEMAPTLVRHTVTGICSSFSKLGAVLSPYIMFLGKTVHPRIPFLIMGIGAIVSGILTLFFLPETKNMNLPNTIEDTLKMKQKITCMRFIKNVKRGSDEEQKKLNQEDIPKDIA